MFEDSDYWSRQVWDRFNSFPMSIDTYQGILILGVGYIKLSFVGNEGHGSPAGVIVTVDGGTVCIT